MRKKATYAARACVTCQNEYIPTSSKQRFCLPCGDLNALAYDKARRHPKPPATHCKRGHEFTPENTGASSSGGRFCKTCYIVTSRNYNRTKLYDCPPEKYERVFKEQNGLCKLPSCGHPIEATDHCHTTGKFRGLLCKKHNLAIGLFSDDPVGLREAAEYLEKFNVSIQLHNPISR
jgi:Recombination endonuclease VII